MESAVNKLFRANKMGLSDAKHEEIRESLVKIAQLLDGIEIGLADLDLIMPSRERENYEGDLKGIKVEFDSLLKRLPGLHPQQIDEQIRNFKSGKWRKIVELQSYTFATRIATNKKALSLNSKIYEAIEQADQVQESVAKTLDDFTEASTTKLAKFFDKKAGSLRSSAYKGKYRHVKRFFGLFGVNDDSNSPEYWRRRRALWMVLIIFFTSLTGFFALRAEVDERYWIIIAAKASIVALFYIQMRFATKNYHIFSDLRESYEYKAIVGNTLITFLASDHKDEVLKKSILENSSKVLFSPVESGHLDHAKKDDDAVIGQVINNLPGSK